MISKVPKGDWLIAIGDFNARVGNNVEMRRGVFGRHGENLENDNGRRLLNFNAKYELQVNTHSYHKLIHKYT